MLLLDLPDDVLDNIYSLLSQNSLMSLKQTCKYLQNVTDFYLLQNIYFYDEDRQMKPYEDGIEMNTKFTFIPLSKLPEFTLFLKHNLQLVQSVNFINFGRCINSQITELVSLLLQHNPRNLLCFRYEGQKLTFLSDNVDHRNGTTRLYENDEIDENESLVITVSDRGVFNCFKNCPLYLSSLYVYNDEDTRKATDMRLRLKRVDFYIDNPYTTSHLSSDLIETWSKSLDTLTFNNTASYRYLNQSLKAYAQLDNNSYIKHLFYNVKTLSLFISDDDTFRDLYALRSLNISNVKNLEIKFKRVRFNVAAETNREIVGILNKKMNCKKLKQLAIINLNYYNMLDVNNIYKDEINGDDNLCYSMLNHFNVFGDDAKHLTTLTLCLNTFLSIPGFFPVTEEYIKRKEDMFYNLERFENMKTLILPDFLFNWLPFLRQFGDINNEYDNKGNGFIPTSERIIGSSYKRFNNFDQKSSLNMTDFPPLKHCHNIQTSDYLDALVPVIKYIATMLPKLQLLNLGGFMISIHRYDNGTVESFNGVYDSWTCLRVA